MQRINRRKSLLWIVEILLLAALAACQGPARETQAPVVYQNPVFAQDFPDPHILRVDESYYGFSTNSGEVNIQVIHSNDLSTWELLGDALPELPAWAVEGNTWAPSVLQVGDEFILYYAARHREAGVQCISYGVSDQPAGPYLDLSTEPFLCHTTCETAMVDSIDPYPFVDENGQAYLYWSAGTDACNNVRALWGVPLAADGRNLTGEKTVVLLEDQYWEAGGLENPAVFRQEENYYLLYSANLWQTADYKAGYALCAGPLTGCEKPLEEPILQFDWQGTVAGPGGQSIFTDQAGRLWLAYHAWTYPQVGYPRGERSLHIDPLQVEGETLHVLGPTENQQTGP